MTREEAIRILEVIRSRSIVNRTSDALLMAINVLKENEPAPSEDNTGYENQKKYFRNNNDTSKKAKCQEEVDYQHKYLKLNDVVGSVDEKLDKLNVILNDLSEDCFNYNININNFAKAIRILNTPPKAKTEKISSADKAAEALIVEFGRIQTFFDIALDYCFSIKTLLINSKEVSQ